MLPDHILSRMGTGPPSVLGSSSRLIDLEAMGRRMFLLLYSRRPFHPNLEDMTENPEAPGRRMVFETVKFY
jgi:hypothetical protein